MTKERQVEKSHSKIFYDQVSALLEAREYAFVFQRLFALPSTSPAKGNIPTHNQGSTNA